MAARLFHVLGYVLTPSSNGDNVANRLGILQPDRSHGRRLPRGIFASFSSHETTRGGTTKGGKDKQEEARESEAALEKAPPLLEDHLAARILAVARSLSSRIFSTRFDTAGHSGEACRSWDVCACFVVQ